MRGRRAGALASGSGHELDPSSRPLRRARLQRHRRLPVLSPHALTSHGPSRHRRSTDERLSRHRAGSSAASPRPSRSSPAPTPLPPSPRCSTPRPAPGASSASTRSARSALPPRRGQEGQQGPVRRRRVDHRLRLHPGHRLDPQLGRRGRLPGDELRAGRRGHLDHHRPEDLTSRTGFTGTRGAVLT